MSNTRAQLSKSRFQAGLQCPKYLWLLCHARDLADDVTEVQQALFDQGHRVGELARRRFPGGTLVAEDYRHPQAALATTARLLDEAPESRGRQRCLYEAAFEYDGVLVRVDILRRRTDGCFDLVEVKSGTKLEEHHLSDAAIQLHVVEGAGLPVGSVYLMHLDREYGYQGGPYDLERLFVLEDVTGPARDYQARIPARVQEMHTLLAGECPDALVGRHCRTPHDCVFLEHCHAFLPELPVTEIPRIGADTLTALLTEGIHAMAEVPRHYPGLTPAQQAVCSLAADGGERYAPGLAAELEALETPLHFLDFETYRPALPVHPGTHPYHLLPVQWSCHTLDEDGSISHREHLHTAPTDPRRPFATSLLEGLPSRGHVVVYTGYESTVLGRLASELPDLASGLAAVRERLYDLERVVRNHVAHAALGGRTSLKRVLPAFAPDVSYDMLSIRAGDVASTRYEAAESGGMSAGECQAVFADLRLYCATDTLGLLRLYQALQERCREVPSAAG